MGESKPCADTSKFDSEEHKQLLAVAIFRAAAIGKTATIKEKERPQLFSRLLVGPAGRALLAARRVVRQARPSMTSWLSAEAKL